MGLSIDASQHRESVWTAFALIGVGLFVLIRYGLTREPLHFNSLNPWKKPLPVWAARLIYIPMGLIALYWGIQGLIQALR